MRVCMCVCLSVRLAVGGNRADVRRESERGCVHSGTTETCHIDFQWSCGTGVLVCASEECVECGSMSTFRAGMLSVCELTSKCNHTVGSL